MCKSWKVAVLLAAYNGKRWIDEQVDSILAQEGVAVTLFINVDSSDDGTEAHVIKLSEKHQNIKALPFGKKFGGAARNFFHLINTVNLSDFDYVSLADQDDIWDGDKLLRAINAINHHKVDGYSSNVTAFWDSGKKKPIDKAQAQNKFDFLFEAAGPGCTYVLNAALVCSLKAVIAKHWLELQEVNLHDWFIYAHARANKFHWYIDPKPSMLYRQHSSNQVGINSGWKAFHYRLTKLSDGWGLKQALLIARLIGFDNSNFVKSWGSLSTIAIIKLSLNALKCRRRTRDKIAFMFVCWIIALRNIIK